MVMTSYLSCVDMSIDILVSLLNEAQTSTVQFLEDFSAAHIRKVFLILRTQLDTANYNFLKGEIMEERRSSSFDFIFT